MRERTSVLSPFLAISEVIFVPFHSGLKPGFAASDPAVLFGYTTHPLVLAPGNPTRIS